MLLLAAAEDWSRGVVPEAERLVAEGPTDPTEELRFCPEEKEEWFSSFKKCILWSSKRRGAVSGPPTHITSFSHRHPSAVGFLSPSATLASQCVLQKQVGMRLPTGRTKVATAPSTEQASVTASSAPSQPRPLCCPVISKVTREPGKGCRLSGLLSPLSHPAGCWHWSHFSIPWGQQTAVPPPLEGGLGWKASCPGTYRPCFSPVCFIDFLAHGKSLPFLPGLLSIFLLC